MCSAGCPSRIPRSPHPLVQGADNDYYLAHTWNRSSSAVGAIFHGRALRLRPEGGFNTVIYGHRMNNGSMFASLKYYNDPSYRQGIRASVS